jgi:hypothetical protein
MHELHAILKRRDQVDLLAGLGGFVMDIVLFRTIHDHDIHIMQFGSQVHVQPLLVRQHAHLDGISVMLAWGCGRGAGSSRDWVGGSDALARLVEVALVGGHGVHNVSVLVRPVIWELRDDKAPRLEDAKKSGGSGTAEGFVPKLHKLLDCADRHSMCRTCSRLGGLHIQPVHGPQFGVFTPISSQEDFFRVFRADIHPTGFKNGLCIKEVDNLANRQ